MGIWNNIESAVKRLADKITGKKNKTTPNSLNGYPWQQQSISKPTPAPQPKKSVQQEKGPVNTVKDAAKKAVSAPSVSKQTPAPVSPKINYTPAKQTPRPEPVQPNRFNSTDNLSPFNVVKDPSILKKDKQENWDFYNSFKDSQAKNPRFDLFGAQRELLSKTTPTVTERRHFTRVSKTPYTPSKEEYYSYNYNPQIHTITKADQYKDEAKPYIAAGKMVPGLFNDNRPKLINREYSRKAVNGVLFDIVIYTDENGKKSELIKDTPAVESYDRRYLAGFMTEDEQAAYYYLRGRYGEDRSNTYVSQLTSELDKRALDADTEKRYYSIGREDPILARVVTTLGGYGKAVDSIQIAARKASGQSYQHEDYNTSTAMRALEEGENAGHGALYRFINSAVNGALENAGFTPLEAIPVIGTGAAIAANYTAAVGEAKAAQIAAGTADAKNADIYASVYGVINSVEYGMLGKYFRTPLSKLGKIGPLTSKKSYVTNGANALLSNLGIGATQSLLSNAADSALMGENSTYNQLVRQYRTQGHAEKEAEQLALRDIASGVAQSALAAGLLGTVMAIPNIRKEGVSFRKHGEELRKKGYKINDILDTAEAASAGSDARRNAQAIRKGIASGSITEKMYDEVMGAQDILNMINAQDQKTYINRMQELTGMRILEGPVSHAQANAEYFDGNIILAPDINIPREQAVAHETQHGAGTEQLHTAISGLPHFEKAVDSIIADRRARGIELSRAEAADEIASLITQTFTQRTKDVDRLIRLAEDNPSLADRMYNLVKDLTAKYQSARGKMFYDESTGLSIGAKELRNIEKLWENDITTVKERGHLENGSAYSVRESSDTKQFGRNIDSDLTEYTRSLGMNKNLWKRANKSGVKKYIRDAYRLFDNGKPELARTVLHDAGSVIADNIKLKRGQTVDIDSRATIIKNFTSAFEDFYNKGKANKIMQQLKPQEVSDRQLYGVGVNKYVRDIMRSIGATPSRINEVEEDAVRTAFTCLINGDEQSARAALDKAAWNIYHQAKAELEPRDRDFLKAVRNTALDLSAYSKTGELIDGELERLRQLTGGTTEKSGKNLTPDVALEHELKPSFPEYFDSVDDTDPARAILEAYDRVNGKTSEPRYSVKDIEDGVEDFKDRVITDFRYMQPAAKETDAAQRMHDKEHYGSDIEADFRSIDGITEGEVKRSSEVVRKTLDGILEGSELWDDPLSAWNELERNICETVQEVTKNQKRSTDEKQRLAVQIMQSVYNNGDSTLALAKERYRDLKIKAAIEGNAERLNYYKNKFDELYKKGNSAHEEFSLVFSNTGQKSWLTSEMKAAMAENANSFTYRRQSNMDSYRAAQARLEEYTPDEIFDELAAKTGWDAVDTVTTELLVTYYQSVGNIDKAVLLMELARAESTRSGQMTQAWAFVNRLTPQGKLRAWEREYGRNMEAQIRKKYPGQADELIAEYREAKSKQEAARQAYRDELYETNDEYRRIKDEISDNEPDVIELIRRQNIEKGKQFEITEELNRVEARNSEVKQLIENGRRTEQAAKELISATDELISLQQQLKDIHISQYKKKAVQEQIAKLQEQIDKAKADMDGMYERIESSERRARKLRELAASKDADRAEIQQRLKEAMAEVEALENQVAELEKELADLRRDETEAARRAFVADDKLDKLKREQRRLQKNLSHIERMSRNDASEADMMDYIEKFYERLGINHISEIDMDAYRDAFLIIEEMNTPESLIDIILRQSEQRHTARGPVTKKILEGMIKDDTPENMELLKSIATQQLFGIISDAERASGGKIISTILAMSQLINPRTAIRNILSNGAFSVTENITHNAAALLDWGIMQHISGERSISFETPFTGYKNAWTRSKKSYLEQGLNVNIIDRSPTAVSPTKRRTFKRGPGAVLERTLGYELSVTDEFAKGVAEGRLHDGLIKIGYTEDEATEIIKQEALYRTFQDDSLPAQALQKAKEALNVFGVGSPDENGIHDFGLGNLITNYTIVPGNILMRSIEYSPVGTLKIVKDLYEIGRGAYGLHKMGNSAAKPEARRRFVRESQRKLLLDITRPLTGAALIWAGYMLKKKGIIVMSHSDEDDYSLSKYDKAKGMSDMQVNLSALMRMFKKTNPDGKDTIESAFEGCDPQEGDTLVDFGWMQPVNSALSAGARIATETGGIGYNLFSIDGMQQLISANAGSAYESVQDLAMWSGINNIVKNYKNTENPGEFLFAEASDLALSFYPSVVNQIGNIIDKKTRYPYKADNVFELSQWKLYSKLPIPALREQVPEKVNLWGEKQSSTLGNAWLDTINSMLSPGNISKYRKSPMTDELDRLAALDSSILPKTPYKENKTTIDDVNYVFTLTGYEYQDFSQMLGQETYKNMMLFMNSEDYKLLSDSQRTETLSDISYETNKSIQKAYGMMSLGKSKEEIKAAVNEHKEEYKMAASKYVLIRQATDYIQSPGVNVEDIGITAYTLRDYTKEEAAEAIKKNNQYIAKVKSGTYYSWKEDSNGKSHKVYSRNWTAAERTKKIKEFEEDNEKINSSTKQKREYITGKWTDLSPEQQKQLLKNIAKYTDEITLPDEVRKNKPDMSGEGYKVDTNLPAQLPKASEGERRSLTELIGNPEFSIDNPQAYDIDGGKAAKPKSKGILSGNELKSLTAYSGYSRTKSSKKRRYKAANTRRKYQYKRASVNSYKNGRRTYYRKGAGGLYVIASRFKSRTARKRFAGNTASRKRFTAPYSRAM